MRILRKAIIFVLLFCLVFSFSGCSDKEETSSETSSEVSKTEESSESSFLSYSEYMAELEAILNENINDTLQAADWRKHPNDYKLIAFTFDDAPAYTGIKDNPTMTIIKALNKYEGAGTFFVNGTRINSNGFDLLKIAIHHGFELGNHTYSHPYLSKLSKDEVREEITKVNDMLNDTLGVTPKFLRPGYVDCGGYVYEVATELNMPLVGGNPVKLTMDYDTTYNSMYVKSTIIQNASDGAVILLHSWSESTAEIIEETCEKLYNDGYRFVTLSELCRYKGKNFKTNDCLKELK